MTSLSGVRSCGLSARDVSARAAYNVAKLVAQYGQRGNISKWVSDLRGDCPKRNAAQLHERCDFICPVRPEGNDRMETAMQKHELKITMEIRATPASVADAGKVRLGGESPSFGPVRAAPAIFRA